MNQISPVFPFTPFSSPEGRITASFHGSLVPSNLSQSLDVSLSSVILTVLNYTSQVCWRRQWHPTPVSCLENPMDGGAWWAAGHGVVKSQTRLSDFPFTFHFHALDKEMATHSCVLAWRIPGTVEPGGLPSMGSHRVEHD